jgi:phenylacetic acid degradation operon negative regulatory protein
MRPRSLLFTLFGDFIRYYGGEVWAGSLIHLLQEFAISPQAVRVAISRMTSEGWLQNRRAGKKSFYVLTQRGEKRLAEGAKRIYKLENPPWNGEWLIVTYTLPEDHKATRERFRRELAWTGFGQLTRSVWASPRDLQPQLIELIQRYHLEGKIDFFTARYQGPENNRALVHKCWDLETIQQRYAEFIALYQGKLARYQQHQAKQDAIPDNECFREEILLIHEYRKFLFIDPGLPDELLPEQWLGRDAARLLHEYYHQVSPAAHRFFEQVFVAYPDSEKQPIHPHPCSTLLDPFAEELRRHRLGLLATTE